MRRLLRDDQGLAAVEFGLMSGLILILFLVFIDFGLYAVEQTLMAQAIDTAGTWAYVNKSAINTTTIQNAVTSNGLLSGATVTVTCNGTATCTNTSRTCACLTASGTYTAAVSCGAVCTGSTLLSGYYVTISASQTYHSIIVPGKFLDGTTISRTSTVQLQ